MKLRIKGGVMIYALVMLSLFSLFLQFYVYRVVATARNQKAMADSSEAYIMAYLTKEWLTSQTDKGSFRFNKGKTSYQLNGHSLSVDVDLDDASHYQYSFYIENPVDDRDSGN